MAFDITRFASTLPSCRPRTIETVTEEILDIKQRVAEDFMELGQRLCEAKELLPHGEWLPWLANHVQFSERQAQKFMALARGYESNPQLAADFGSEKAFALLDLPMEEREQIAAEGATVGGKTKSAADLTTREVKQIVAERKSEAEEKAIDFRAVDYLIQRDNEDAKYREMLHGNGFWVCFAESIFAAGNRQAGIDILKNVWRHRGGTYARGGYTGSPKGLKLHDCSGATLERTWTEVWDTLAVIALQEAAQKHATDPLPFEPEGQLAIAAWMPGGTNPGKESGLCACMMPLDPEKEPVPVFLFWDGDAGQWMFANNSATVDMEPVGWMRLPEWRK